MERRRSSSRVLLTATALVLAPAPATAFRASTPTPVGEAALQTVCPPSYSGFVSLTTTQPFRANAITLRLHPTHDARIASGTKTAEYFSPRTDEFYMGTAKYRYQNVVYEADCLQAPSTGAVFLSGVYNGLRSGTFIYLGECDSGTSPYVTDPTGDFDLVPGGTSMECTGGPDGSDPYGGPYSKCRQEYVWIEEYVDGDWIVRWEGYATVCS